jgi:ribosomal protein L7/L12
LFWRKLSIIKRSLSAAGLLLMEAKKKKESLESQLA